MQHIANNIRVCLNNIQCIYGALSVFVQTHMEEWGALGIHKIKLLLLCRQAIVFGGFPIERNAHKFIRWGMGHIVDVNFLGKKEEQWI